MKLNGYVDINKYNFCKYNTCLNEIEDASHDGMCEEHYRIKKGIE